MSPHASRVLVLGNSGAGKTTLARRLATERDLVHLDLDTVVWEPHQVAVARADADVVSSLKAFLASQPRFVIEGSYGDWIDWLAPHANALFFLDPDLETCLRHHRERPHEPHKYDDPAQQDAKRTFLEDWVRTYPTRDDRFGRAWHLGVFERFPGEKVRVLEIE